MKHFKKLNASGFAHWVIPAVVLVLIGGIGSYLLTQSHADAGVSIVTVSNQQGCKFTGRVWTGSSCAYNQCRSGSIANPSASASFHYCTGYIAAEIGQGPCNVTYHRTYVQNVGCARAYADITGPTVCYDSAYPNYTANAVNGNDACVAPAPAPTASTPVPAPTDRTVNKTAKCTVTGPTSVAYGNSGVKYNITITNTSPSGASIVDYSSSVDTGLAGHHRDIFGYGAPLAVGTSVVNHEYINAVQRGTFRMRVTGTIFSCSLVYTIN